MRRFLPLFILGLQSCAAPETPAPAVPSVAAPDTNRIATIQERLRADGPHSPALGGTDAHAGTTEADIRSRFGRPIASATQGRKALLVYRTGTEDATALYLFLEDGVVIRSKSDEFNGLNGSPALDWLLP